MIIKIGNKVLAGNGSEGAADLRVNGNRIVEEQEFCRAEEPDFVDRGNRRTVVEFNVTRLFETTQLCETFILDHDDDTPVVDDVTLGVEDGGGGMAAAKYLRKASCQTLDFKQSGQSCVIRYRIVGGKFYTNIS